MRTICHLNAYLDVTSKQWPEKIDHAHQMTRLPLEKQTPRTNHVYVAKDGFMPDVEPM